MPERERPEKPDNRVSNAMLSLMQRLSPRMRILNICAMTVAVIFAIATLVTMQSVLRTRAQIERTNDAYQACQQAANDLQESSDYLTTEARLYVTTVNRTHLDNYLNDLEVIDSRGKAIKALHDHATSDEAVEALEAARTYSDRLAHNELYALRLAAESQHLSNMPHALEKIVLSASDANDTPTAQRSKAHTMVYGDEYVALKLSIREQVHQCSALLVDTLRDQLDENNARMTLFITAMNASVLLLLVVVAFVIASTTLLLLRPIAMYEDSIREDKPLDSIGALELRHLTVAYNEMYNANHVRTESLSYEADHDALTGLLNRGSFEELLTLHKHNSALLLVDVDYFKHFNDDYGHDMGDAVLIEVAATLFDSFRSSDFVFRIGGDEFAVIMTMVDDSLRDMIASKVERVSEFLRDTSNGLPAVTISVGIAFGNINCADDGLFQMADKALYLTKKRGRDGYAFSDEVPTDL